jgi:RHS repeat-associated protein
MYTARMIPSKKVRLFFLLLAACLLVCGNLPVVAAASGVRLSVKPLNLSRPPNTQELMAAGQLGGELYPTHILRDAGAAARANLSFGEAMQAWNQHDYARAAEMLAQHVQKHPDSPWVSEAVLHLGCYAQYQERHADAEESFTWILEKNRGSGNPGTKALLNKARLRLGVLRVAQDRFEEAQELFRELKEQGHDWRHRTYASHWIQRISRYKADKRALLDCGTKALAYVLEKRGQQEAAREVANLKPRSLRGHSVEALAELAARYGQELVAVKLPVTEAADLSLPAILYVTRDATGEHGHYWVLEKSGEERLELLDPQSGKRFVHTFEQLAKEWSGVALVLAESKTLPGTRLGKLEMEQLFGGCCGIPRPPDRNGDPGPNKGPGGPKGDSCGTPRWSVNMVNMNLYMVDTPLWYASPIGPSVHITLSYNSQSSITYHEPFGNKWQFNYSSYLVVDPSETVTIFMPDGRIDVYPPDGSGGYKNPYQVFNKLTKMAENHFELRFPDDAVHVYKIPAGSGAMQPYLVEIRDAHGQKLTLGYDTSVQLTSLTDAMGRQTTLVYDSDGLVKQVDDPFGRSAFFEYDESRNLIQITDMGGYWSKLSYDGDVYLTGLENQRGKWEFYIEPADGVEAYFDDYPPPGGDMWASYRVTVTNPLKGKAEYFYWGGGDTGSWYVSPRDYVPYVSQSINNLQSAAMTEYGLARRGQNGELSSTDYPAGGSVSYKYDAKGNRTALEDGHYHAYRYTYNDMGRMTSVTDPRGIVTQNVYAPNGVDLLQVKNGLGSIVRTYNTTHQVTSIRDRMQNPPWTFTYNGYGQLEKATDPLGVPTEYIYDANHQLEQIKRDGNVTDIFKYDLIGRIASRTDATGLTLSYDYNDLNHVTKIIYPDGKYVEYTYAGCCPRLVEQITDRGGRSKHYVYDELQRLTKVIDYAGKVTTHLYDQNGNLIMLVDPNGNTTTFIYDLNDRPIKKTYADGQSVYFYYDKAGLLIGRTNARGITTAYGYDDAHNLATVSYSDDTPGVTYAYDDYDRMVQRHDGTGAYVFTYDKDSRLKSVNGPWPNDTVTYTYDEQGRRKGLAVQGGQSLGYKYDRQTRLEEIQIGATSYKYIYAGVNPLVQTLTSPNGTKTNYEYGLLNRLELISHRNSADDVIQEYGYEYNDRDLRSKEKRVDGNPVLDLQNGFTLYDHNVLNQLLHSATPDRNFLYDNDGNLIQGYTPMGYKFRASYDAENRLESVQYTDTGAGNALRLTKYLYSGDGILASMKQYQNGTLVSQARYVRDGLLSLQERDGSNAVKSDYIWGLNRGGGIGGLLQLGQGGKDYVYLYDGRGNVTALTDSAQLPAAAYSYDGYGNRLHKIGAVEQPFQFSTKPYDEKIGISYYGYRFYSPSMGRWSTRDPLGELGGTNLYTYALNSPVNFSDPFGLYANVTVVGNDVFIEIPISYSGPGATLDVINKFNEAIRDYWSDQFGEFTVHTEVTTGTDNQIYVPCGKGRAFMFKEYYKGYKRGKWPSESSEWTAAHEAGHMIGLEDRYYEETKKPWPGWENNIMGKVGKRPDSLDILFIISKWGIRFDF